MTPLPSYRIDFFSPLPHHGYMDQDLLVIDPFNRAEDSAPINRVHPAIQQALFEAYKARPDLFGKGEEDFLDLADTGPRAFRGNGLVNCIRMKFWLEYDEAISHSRKMNTHSLYNGLCERQTFAEMIRDPIKMAWIFTRPPFYDATIASLHQYSLLWIRKMLEEPDSRAGKDRPAIIAAKLKIFEQLELRVKGSVVQKTMNVHATVKQAAGPEDKTNQLEKRLEDLETSAGQARAKVIDTSALDVK